MVFWDGLPTARVMAVGQWPGRDEDVYGIPFQGKLGRMCRQMLIGDTTGIPADDIFWTNVIGCRIPDGSTFRVTYSDNCHDLLEHQIQLVKPLLIVAMGRVAMSRLCGTRTVKVEQLEGSEGVYKGICTMYIKHPAYLGRIQNTREREKARQALGEQLSGIHKRYHELIKE